MTFGEIFRFELAYRLRQPMTWGLAAFLFAAPFLLLHAIDGSTVTLNAPESVATQCTIFGMIGMLVTAALFGDAATRDVHTRMHALFYTAPLRPAAYLGGRFLATLLVNAVLLLGVPLGLLAAAVMPYAPDDKFGPTVLAAYAQPYLLLLLPNLVLAAAALFAVAALTRHTLAAFLAAIGLFVANLVVGDVTAGMSSRTIAAVADPFGVSTLTSITRYWTLAERETLLVGFPTILLWNRLLWLGVALAVLALLAARFRFAHPGGERRRRAKSEEATGGATPRAIHVPSGRREFGLRAQVRQTIEVAGRGLRETMASRIFLLVLAGAVFLTFAVGWEVGAQVFGTSTWPVTHLIAGTVLGTVMSQVIVLLVAVFAGELVWRERDLRVSEIADAAPVPGGVLLAGRFLALVAMIVVLQAVLMASGVLLQAARGYHEYELGLYARMLFGFHLADYLLFAVLAMAVHVIVDQKYVAHLIVVATYFATVFAGLLGVQHQMLVYGGDPGWIYSDMNGFGPFTAPFVWFKLYWAAWALLLAVLASLFLVRGRDTGGARRLRLARRRFTGTAVGAAATAASLVLLLGGFVFYNTNVLNEYRTPEEVDALVAEYERRYKRWERLPQPQITDATLRVEIHPERRAVDMGGSYRLVNRTAAPIDSVHVLVLREVDVRSIALDRPATAVLEDDTLGYRIYDLAAPLQPGDSLRLTFDVGVAPRGFPNGGINTSVARNGAYFDARWLPFVGYQPAFEMKDADARQVQGLPPRPDVRPADDTAALQERFDLRNADLVDFDVTIGTAGDQIAVTPGRLQREWTENGRRYFHYRTDVPVSLGVPVLSARYAVRERQWVDSTGAAPRTVPVRVYYHPGHEENVDRMLHSMQASLTYFSRNFGPYQFGELRVLEFPRYASFARAHPHTIAFSEGSAFLTRVDSGDVDRTFFVVAHETAHQWFGGQLIPARVRGAGFMSESMAQYGAMMVMEATYGVEQVRKFYEFEMDLYLAGRRSYATHEVPLLDVGTESHIYYHKGAMAMYTLRELIGAERVNAASRRVLDRHRAGVPPYPTSRELYAEFVAETPDSLRPVLRDWFEEVTLWHLGLDSARAEPTGDGKYRVTLGVTATKVRADSTGREVPVPMDDWVDVAIWGDPDTGPSEPLHFQRHRLRSGQQTLVVTVPSRPTLARIDPERRLIDREWDDNVAKVEAPAARR